MKKRFHSLPVLLFSGIAGLIGFGLQLWLQVTGVDKDGLVEKGHPATIALLGLTLCVFIIIIYIATGAPKDMRFGEKASQRKASAFSCFMAFLGISISLFWGAFPLPAGLLAVGGAICFVLLGLNPKEKQKRFVISFFITVFLVALPLSQYPKWCVDTQVQHYGYTLLACLCLLFAAYHRTETELGIWLGRRLVFFESLAIYFSLLNAWTPMGPLLCSIALWCAIDLLRLQAVVHIRLPLPETVSECIRTLTNAGYPAYAVGGCVRDIQMGNTPHDYDLCTSATPEQIAQVFSRYPLVRNGEKHGTIGVIIDGEIYEITTFRTEGEYQDNRHPNWVSFVNDLDEDLARRDFTINAMAYSPVNGLQDPWHGAADLKKKILRTVGEPEARFSEDALRILRGVRFALRFHLTPDAKTARAMKTCAPLMDNLARERVFSELCQILLLCNAQDLLRFAPVFLQAIPELEPAVGFSQKSPHHAYDVYTHTAYVVEHTPASLPLRWAALLHDIGKPQTFTQDENGRGHFYDHAKVSAQMANDILLRLKAPTALREQVVLLVENHMLPLTPDIKVLRRRLSHYGEDNIRALLTLQQADYAGKGTTEDMPPFALVEALVDNIIADGNCLHLRDLAVSGRDLLAVGFPEGPLIGQCLSYLLDCVLDESLPNNKELLLNTALIYLQERSQLP